MSIRAPVSSQLSWQPSGSFLLRLKTRSCGNRALTNVKFSSSAAAFQRRYIRSRTVNSNVLHQMARVEKAAASSQVSPTTATANGTPSATSLANVISIAASRCKTASEIEGVEALRFNDKLWDEPKSDELSSVWRNLHQAIETAHDAGDVVEAEKLANNDLVGLSVCSANVEVDQMLQMLPPSLRSAVVGAPQFDHTSVEELFVHLGQPVEVRGFGWIFSLPPPSASDVQFIVKAVGTFGTDGRGCLPGTAHRISVWRGRLGDSLGVTMRVGRFVPNVAKALVPLLQYGSLLILSRAGIGKTTLLRDVAATIARNPAKPRVVVVDTSNEIGGDTPVPLPFLGRGRRLQVPARSEQLRVMTEALQNHTPEYIIIDEIGTAEEAQSAWSISQRGVRLVATCHGDSLQHLLQNQALNLLVGGAAQAFLSNEERRLRNKVKKSILERPYSSPFEFVLELTSRGKGYLYFDVNKAVDTILDDRNPRNDASMGCALDLEKEIPGNVLARVMAIRGNGSGEPKQRKERLDDEKSFATSSDDDDDDGVSEFSPSGSKTLQGMDHLRIAIENSAAQKLQKEEWGRERNHHSQGRKEYNDDDNFDYDRRRNSTPSRPYPKQQYQQQQQRRGGPNRTLRFDNESNKRLGNTEGGRSGQSGKPSTKSDLDLLDEIERLT